MFKFYTPSPFSQLVFSFGGGSILKGQFDISVLGTNMKKTEAINGYE